MSSGRPKFPQRHATKKSEIRFDAKKYGVTINKVSATPILKSSAHAWLKTANIHEYAGLQLHCM